MRQSSAQPPVVRQIVRIDYDSHAVRARVPLHMHPFCKLDIILSGGVRLVTEAYRPVPLKAGDAVVVPPLTPHGYEARGRMRHLAIKFHIHPQYRMPMGRRIHRLRVPRHILAAAQECGEAVDRDEPMAVTLAQASATYCATYALGRIWSKKAGNAEPMAMAEPFAGLIDDIAGDPLRPRSVAGMAASCHLSESQFTKRFTRAFVQSPRQYLVDTRMVAAADLLLASNRSIKQVAEAAGYANVHGFTRAFTRVIGRPPAAFRRSQQASQSPLDH